MSSSDAVQTAKAVAAKKNIVIDPEVVRKRRAEKAAQRASAEAAAVTNKDSVTADAASPAHMGFMPRPMVDVTQSEAGPSNVRIKLMTWNVRGSFNLRSFMLADGVPAISAMSGAPRTIPWE